MMDCNTVYNYMVLASTESCWDMYWVWHYLFYFVFVRGHFVNTVTYLHTSKERLWVSGFGPNALKI